MRHWLIPNLTLRIFIWFLNIPVFSSHLHSSQFESFGISIKSKKGEKKKEKMWEDLPKGLGSDKELPVPVDLSQASHPQSVQLC